jgi:cation diffusion facilitator CzcD-associated flavoprotein CzcO
MRLSARREGVENQEDAFISFEARKVVVIGSGATAVALS